MQPFSSFFRSHSSGYRLINSSFQPNLIKTIYPCIQQQYYEHPLKGFRRSFSMKNSHSIKKENIRIGIDVGSTTVKIVALDSKDDIIFQNYQRHKSDVRNSVVNTIAGCLDKIESLYRFKSQPNLNPIVTGSGGLAVSKIISMPFVQEVVASTTAVHKIIPSTDIAIELGGEDAKITYFNGGIEQRMNGTCAGGTGAFIDQMAALFETDASGLNLLSKNSKMIYPIAARCGVFAKTDIQPLINEGARKEDIATSIFQAVVNQTISGLSCGKPIRGKIAFLGGPLYFLDQLKERFIQTLNIHPENQMIVSNSQLFVALGAALSSDKANLKHRQNWSMNDLRSSLEPLSTAELHEVRRLNPLFQNEKELMEFRQKHSTTKCQSGELKDASGPLFLGIDAGSTTTKTVLIDLEGKVLWSFYDSNQANPVSLAVRVLKELYTQLPPSVHIARSCSTGYGEALFQSALGVDSGEVETIAHYRAANFFLPGVEFLLDIGGQDMKCIRIKDGAISSILLNEACSSGCGSFLENFAQSLGLTIQEFSEKSLLSPTPVDLGSRCTVFMNSRVKQAQKEGARVGDISAGLSYSVIKNALMKVIKLRDPSAIGSKIVVQGGTFQNDAVLRAFELISGKEVIRPDIARLMGAYGAALTARDQWIERGSNTTERSSLCSTEDLNNFSVMLNSKRCGGCSNNCLLTINTFFNGSKNPPKFITGNRCEKGLESNLDSNQIQFIKPRKAPNLFTKKYQRLFNYKPLPKSKAPHGVVGIPRVMNIYENYPLWFTLFTNLGFSVQLSPRSNRYLYESGLESIPSESICFPAKISHGHIESLLKSGIKFIFYPCIPHERKEDPLSDNKFNCPIVTSYPDVLKNNIDQLREDHNLIYMSSFFPIDNKKLLTRKLITELQKHFKISSRKIKNAVQKAWEEQDRFRSEIQLMGESALKEIEEKGLKGVVLSGRPYHLDPEINHGVPELINSLGLAVFTEDSVAHLGKLERPLLVLDQWPYQNRIYRAAQYSTTNRNLEFVQFTSFGCGIDAVSNEQIEEIIRAKGKIFTLLKIDEGSNLGAIRIRIRSLIASMNEHNKLKGDIILKSSAYQPSIFTNEKKESGYTVLSPMLSPFHFRLLEHALRACGHKLDVLPPADQNAIDEGLKYVNNDACYPALIITGQFISALKSGKYDPNKTALLYAQTGGGCVQTNYMFFFRKALKDIGWNQVPVIGLSAQNLEVHEGFKWTFAALHRTLMGFVFGDIFMRCLYRTRPYELVKGSANALYEKWNEVCCSIMYNTSLSKFNETVKQIIHDFDVLPLRNVRKPRIGIVGEILLKYNPTANNKINELLESEGAETTVPGLYDFFLYCVSDSHFNHKILGTPIVYKWISNLIIHWMNYYRKEMIKALRASKRFSVPTDIYDMARLVADIIPPGHNTGEGWFLTAEIVELIHSGVLNIACIQPFTCLPNHITGRGMVKELRRKYPGANIATIDYDPGTSEVNQLNRLKLLLSSAPLGKHPDD